MAWSNYTPEIPGSAFIIGASANPGSVDQGAADSKSRIGIERSTPAANALSDNATPSLPVHLCTCCCSHARPCVEIGTHGGRILFQRAEASRWRITLISLFLAGKLVARLADADEELTALHEQSMRMAFSYHLWISLFAVPSLFLFPSPRFYFVRLEQA